MDGTDEILIAGLDAVADHLDAAGREFSSASARLKAVLAALREARHPTGPPSPDGNPYKKSNGRLTEAGAAAIDAAYSAGATVTEVSRRFGIHTSAASYHRQVWQKKHDPAA